MARPDSAANPSRSQPRSNWHKVNAKGEGCEGGGYAATLLSTGVNSFSYRDYDDVTGGNSSDNDDDDNDDLYSSNSKDGCTLGENDDGYTPGENDDGYKRGRNGGGNETVAGNKPDEYNRGGYERGGNETVGGNEPLGGGNEAVSGGNGTVRGGNETVGGENEAVNVGNETGGGGNGNIIVDRAEGGRRDAYATLVSADDAESQSETAQSETATGSEISPPESEPAPVASTKGKHKAAEVPRTESAAFSRQGEWNGEGEDLTGGRNLPLGGRNNSAGFAATGGDDEVGGTGVRFARDGGGGAELASTGAEGGESTGFPLLKEGGRGMKLAATGSGGDNTGFPVLIEEGAGQGKGEKGSDNGFRTGVAGMGLGLGLGRRSKASIFRQSSGHLSSLASSSAHGEFRGGFGQRAGEWKAFFVTLNPSSVAAQPLLFCSCF